jgi:hypothetical protein
MSWSEIKSSVNSNIGTPLNEAILHTVKSIQRGTASGNQTIAISKVTPSKCIVNLLGGQVAGEGESYKSNVGAIPYVSNFDSTSITISQAYATGSFTATATASYTWQVIEFAIVSNDL